MAALIDLRGRADDRGFNQQRYFAGGNVVSVTGQYQVSHQGDGLAPGRGGGQTFL